MRDLNSTIINPPLGWVPNAGTAINDTGTIAGNGQSVTSSGWPPTNEHAFTISGGSMTVIPLLGVADYAYSINSSGQVVGVAFDSNSREHAFLYAPGKGTRNLGNLGGSGAVAEFVSDDGMVLGGSELADGSWSAFSYTDATGMVNLNTLAQFDGFTFDSAIAMNQNGQIVAEGTNGQETNAFLLTPTPEPSSFALLFCFACILLILQLCRRRLARL